MFLLTLAAQITTLPIMAYQFKQISLVSLIANPFGPACPTGCDDSGRVGRYPQPDLSTPWAINGMDRWPLTAYTIRMVEYSMLCAWTIPFGQSLAGLWWYCSIAVLLTLTFAVPYQGIISP